MIFALADKFNGDPVEDTLKVFLFQNGTLDKFFNELYF